jgi:hypothetical protein
MTPYPYAGAPEGLNFGAPGCTIRMWLYGEIRISEKRVAVLSLGFYIEKNYQLVI